MKKILSILKQSASEFSKDRAMELGAALSFYAVISLAPLVTVVLGIAGMVMGDEAARGGLVHQIEGMVGKKGAEAIQGILGSQTEEQSGIMALVSGVVLLIGASAVFVQLQSALNVIWNVQQKPSLGILYTIKLRLLSMGLVVSIGFLLLVSLVVSTGLAALGNFLSGLAPGMEVLWLVVNFVVALAVVTALFAALFKVLPDAEISWHDVWIGAFVTALLFTIGKFGIGLYLGNSSTASAYGAAGSMIILLLWIYYSSLILFFGAEFTQVYARTLGSRIVPSDHAVRVERKVAEPTPGGSTI